MRVLRLLSASWILLSAAAAQVSPDVPRPEAVDPRGVQGALVIGGAQRANGMPAFEHLDVDMSEAIRSYILSLSQELRETQESR